MHASVKCPTEIKTPRFRDIAVFRDAFSSKEIPSFELLQVEVYLFAAYYKIVCIYLFIYLFIHSFVLSFIYYATR